MFCYNNININMINNIMSIMCSNIESNIMIICKSEINGNSNINWVIKINSKSNSIMYIQGMITTMIKS